MYRTGFRCLRRQTLCRAAKQTSSLIRPLSYGARHMTGSLQQVDPPLPSTQPADSYQLLSDSGKVGESEDALYNEQVKQVNDWWASSRYKGIKRPYSAEDVVSKRGTLQQTYPSSLMARKLFNLLEERASKGEPVHTSPSSPSKSIATRIQADSFIQWEPLIRSK